MCGVMTMSGGFIRSGLEEDLCMVVVGKGGRYAGYGGSSVVDVEWVVWVW